MSAGTRARTISPRAHLALQVQGGPGCPGAGERGAPTLHARGLALLHAGAADTAGLRRAGLLDGSLPRLDAALAAPAPVLLDGF